MINKELIDVMLAKATTVMANAYTPYSKFKVGACIRTANDQLFIGCNNENASYSLTQCAETTAIGNMVTLAGANQIVEVVIIASSDKPCVPCGGCRQRIREFASAETKIHMYGQDGKKKLTMTLNELLPKSFGPEFLQV